MKRKYITEAWNKLFCKGKSDAKSPMYSLVKVKLLKYPYSIEVHPIIQYIDPFEHLCFTKTSNLLAIVRGMKSNRHSKASTGYGKVLFIKR